MSASLWSTWPFSCCHRCCTLFFWRSCCDAVVALKRYLAAHPVAPLVELVGISSGVVTVVMVISMVYSC